jgi:hypothetical protein
MGCGIPHPTRDATNYASSPSHLYIQKELKEHKQGLNQEMKALKQETQALLREEMQALKQELQGQLAEIMQYLRSMPSA